MDGPFLEKENKSKEEENTVTSYSNQILEYLLGFTPKIETDATQDKSKDEKEKLDKHQKVTEMQAKRPNVNSRDAKLHFLMGRYNSNKGLFAHDDLANEIRHRMALDTAFFSLFPDIYEVDGTVPNPEKAALRVPKDFDCLRFLLEAFENKCMPFSDYGLGHIKYIVEYCETNKTSAIVEKAVDMGSVCANLVV